MICLLPQLRVLVLLARIHKFFRASIHLDDTCFTSLFLSGATFSAAKTDDMAFLGDDSCFETSVQYLKGYTTTT